MTVTREQSLVTGEITWVLNLASLPFRSQVAPPEGQAHVRVDAGGRVISVHLRTDAPHHMVVERWQTLTAQAVQPLPEEPPSGDDDLISLTWEVPPHLIALAPRLDPETADPTDRLRTWSEGFDERGLLLTGIGISG